jgi:hypothetical protein
LLPKSPAQSLLPLKSHYRGIIIGTTTTMGAQASRAPQPGRNYPPILLKWYTYPLLALLGLYSYLKFKSEDILRDLHFILRLARGKRHLQAVATKKQYGIVDTFMQRVLEFVFTNIGRAPFFFLFFFF